MDDSHSLEERIAGADYNLFATIVREGSLAAAGRALGISAPMASKRLARLEGRLGARLVHRTTRRLALTERGAAFHADVVRILGQIAEAERRVGGRSDVAHGPLHMTAPTSFGRLHVAPHLAGFVAAHPQVALRLDLSDDYVDLLAGRIDLAIRITAAVPRGLDAHRLGTSRRILCAAPAYLDTAGTPTRLRDLSDHRLLAAAGQLPWRLFSARGRHLVEGRSHVATNSSEVVRELAIAGAGIALRSLWDVRDDLAAGRLVRILPQLEGSSDVGIYAVRPQAPAAPPAVAAMTAHLAAAYGPSPPWEG